MIRRPASIAPDVWTALPPDIQAELSAAETDQPINVDNGPVPPGIDATVWASLPPELRSEFISAPDSPPPSSSSSSFALVSFGRRSLPLRLPKEAESATTTTTWIYSVAPDTERQPASAAPLLNATELWTDEKFVADASAIDGFRVAESSPSTATVSPVNPKCGCNKAARLKTVYKENKNHGRKFFACAAPQAKGCSFFMWAPETGQFALRHSKEHTSIEWKRLSLNLLASPSDEYSPNHIRQGRVGDCWFVSALSVIAENPALLHRVLPSQPGPKHGYFLARFFIDGKWQEYCVDNYFPLMPPEQVKKSTVASHPGPHLYFAKAVNKNIWVPVLEKAYAKAHSSYQAISGGQIAEALFDLTGFPTESIPFGGIGFDSELFWTRLLSFQSQGFLMGAVCPQSGDGLVGGHAYSLLQVVEESIEDGLVIGKTKNLHDYFDAGVKRKWDDTQEFGVTDHGTLRLIKLRNPWGKVEWKGKFGVDSAEWSSSLRKRLNHDQKEDEGGGVFWISYHDFLTRFSQVDVCFTHLTHQLLNIECTLPPGLSIATSSIIELSVPDPTLIYISLCQRTKRGKPAEDFYYTDLNLLLLTLSDNDPTEIVSIQDLRMFGQGRDNHFDLFLGERGRVVRYLLVPFSVERETAIQEAKVFKKGMNRVGSGESKQLTLKGLEFTVRIMSANCVGASFRKWKGGNTDFVWDAVERGICDTTLVGRSGLNGSLNLVKQMNLPTPFYYTAPRDTWVSQYQGVWTSHNFTLRLVESRGLALAHFTNTHEKLWIRIRVELRAATKTYNSTQQSVWRVVPPKTRRIIGSCVCPSWEGVYGHQVIAMGNIEWESFVGGCQCEDLGDMECGCRVSGLFGEYAII
ncbi:cysteine proteinase [Rhizoclosmatium globosum]|uniref:Cysteine proteinase n=1 Tax=Rhizoclosmatium globosum TaxID=329046 RepID=A0A1Y2CX62_9FUNG|nr:cysteine proteinase [Rhizoclosmatium globosum]|eukprot:ORY51621.1 cysteine proteinase [Rhizoclosmatium globosum]